MRARSLTSDYFDGLRGDLTAQADGRQSSSLSPPPSAAKSSPLTPENETNAIDETIETQADESETYESTYDLLLMIEPKGIACSCACGVRKEEWIVPKTVIRRPNKAISIGTLLNQLAAGSLQGHRLGSTKPTTPNFCLRPRGPMP